MDINQLISDLKYLLIPGVGSVVALKNAAKNWYQQYQELLSTPDNQLSPELLIEKRDLQNRGKNIMEKIETLGLTADTLQGNLGALPFIAIGVIVTAAGMMLYWTYDFVKFRDKLNEYKSLRASGMTHQQATDAIKVIDGGIFSNIEGATKWIGLGALGIGLIYFAKKQRWI